MGYQAGEIPMYNVHGISVAGGTFPAEIWRLFMQDALVNEPTRNFLLPLEYPTYKDWHGEWQYSGGSYVPTTTTYYSEPAPAPAPAPAPTPAPQAKPAPPATHEKKKEEKKPPPPSPTPAPTPPPVTATEPPPEP